ncbi:olfactory receptor 14I1-like [Mauremys reevesii]|uniref:olfactory receptor 14I1-like n=1 Tax=Mauremys reevesii TaxID=260615 RepID=UPI00193F124D|nr:olfactory receptor 14I1-like [Mauremys reevesii]
MGKQRINESPKTSLDRFKVAITEKLAHTELVQMNGTYWCVTAHNHSIELNGKPCPSRHPSVCMIVPRRSTLTVDGMQLHHTLPMMGNLTWDQEWHYGSKYLGEGLQALQAKIEELVAEAQRHIEEGRLRYAQIGETVDQADVKYSKARNQAVEVKAIIMSDAISVENTVGICTYLTTVTEFLLLAFSDIWKLQILHFMVFLVLYFLSLVGNLLIFIGKALDHHLHTPMYFFLMNLSILDLGSVSVTIPKSMVNSLMNTRWISYSGCVAQVFLFAFFASADYAILTVMAYDQYVAICQPLYYETMMNRRACVQMAASAWISIILYSAVHTGNTFAVSFCGGNMVDQFFCKIPKLLKLACSGSDLSELGLLIFSLFLCLSCFVFIIVSYVQIFTVLRIPSEQGRHKAFSTCLPHLIVVSLFLCTAIFAYLKPISSSPSVQNLLVAVLYSVLPPMMNPIIYSMRNKEIKGALNKLIDTIRWSSDIYIEHITGHQQCQEA